MRCNIDILNEVNKENTEGWKLCLQYCKYNYTGNMGEKDYYEHGYRFIWRRPGGSLSAARGQARIPSINIMYALINMAKEEGWGDLDGGFKKEYSKEMKEATWE